MDAVLKPASAEDVRAIVADAAASGTPLAPRGHGTKSGLGRPVEHRALDLSGLSGVTLYEPDELVMSALAGTPLDEIVRMLDENGQELAFEPPLRHLLWGDERAGTIGGMVMSALSGPRRIKAGAVRDHVLGVTAVSGRGEIFKAGGRVVKNVTGYDVAKGLVGSFGTLAVLTDVTLKVLPKAETEATLLIENLSDQRAVAAMSAAMGAPVDVSGAAHLPARAAAAMGFSAPTTLIRLEGFEPSVNERFTRLSGLLAEFGPAHRLDRAASAKVWTALCQITPLAAPAGAVAWRVSVKPTAGPAMAAEVPDALAFFDWAGGLVWLAVDPDAADGHAATIRAAVAAAGGGHATLMRAPPELRARVPVFQPQPAPLAALSRRLKAEFDPMNILNPGRMAEGL